jgi:hypothetical protein
MLATAALTSSKAGLPGWSVSWPGWNGKTGPAWSGCPESLAADLAKVDPGAFSTALDRAIVGAASEFAAGIKA